MCLLVNDKRATEMYVIEDPCQGDAFEDWRLTAEQYAYFFFLYFSRFYNIMNAKK